MICQSRTYLESNRVIYQGTTSTEELFQTFYCTNPSINCIFGAKRTCISCQKKANDANKERELQSGHLQTCQIFSGQDLQKNTAQDMAKVKFIIVQSMSINLSHLACNIKVPYDLWEKIQNTSQPQGAARVYRVFHKIEQLLKCQIIMSESSTTLSKLHRMLKKLLRVEMATLELMSKLLCRSKCSTVNGFCS